MKGKRVFLQWALSMSLVAVAAIIAARLGWIGHLRNDPTHVTLVTLGVFAVASAWCGRQAWKLSSGQTAPAEVTEDLEHGWFASSLCVSIGLIGTALGYFLMLKHGNDGGDAKTIIHETFANASIAIINTVVGAVCGVIVELQSHFIGQAAKKAQRGSGKDEKGAP